MNYSGFIAKNSLVHKMNPSLKFLLTIIVIIMIFIPFGFVYQVVLLVFCLSLFFIAKLSFKKLSRILISMLFLACVLALINWVTYKGPGVIFDFKNNYYFLYQPYFLNWNNFHVTIDNQNSIYLLQGSMYGGKIVDVNPTIATNIGNGFYKVINTNTTSALEEVRTLIEAKYSSSWSLKYLTYSITNNNQTYTYFYFYLTKWGTYSSSAITLMLYVTIKIFLMVLIVTILTSTTSSIELTCAIEDILYPLRYLRLPVSEWSMTIALVLRFIPTLIDEANRILNAQASRGLDFKNGYLKEKVLALSSLIIPLFAVAFKKAGELANAMEARGYNPRYARTRYRSYDIHFFDWIIFATSLLLLGILIGLTSLKNHRIFVSFGFWDIFAS